MVAKYNSEHKTGMPCVGLDRFVPVFVASNRTGPVHFQTCIGLNRIDPWAALLYYVPDCTSLYRLFLCTGLYQLHHVPFCTGLYPYVPHLSRITRIELNNKASMIGRLRHLISSSRRGLYHPLPSMTRPFEVGGRSSPRSSSMMRTWTM